MIQTVNIALTFDEEYAQKAGVVIASIVDNCEIEVNYHFYLLAYNVSSISKGKIDDLFVNQQRFSYTILDIDQLEQSLSFFKNSYFHISASARLFLPIILNECSKVIYLDCDVIVKSSLLDLYNTDITEYYAAGVPDYVVRQMAYIDYWNNYFHNIVKIKNVENYCNSGVLVFNLTRMREKDLVSKFLEFGKRVGHTLSFPDQDTINKIMEDNIKLLDQTYNYSPGYDLGYYKSLSANELEDLIKAKGSPKIIHYDGLKKPWKMNMYLSQEYLNVESKLNWFKNMGGIKIYVNYHNNANPIKNNILTPMMLGAKDKESIPREYLRDDTGDNISKLNAKYCELTGQYWVYKNVDDVEYYGFCHYRRHFFFKNITPLERWDGLIPASFSELGSFSDFGWDEENIAKFCIGFDFVLPKITNHPGYDTYTHYKICAHHNIEDLDKIIKTIDKISPEYSESAKEVIYGKALHFLNMFIMRKRYFQEYSAWLFKIFEEADKSIDYAGRSTQSMRALAFIGERMLNIYVHQKMKQSNGIKIKEYPVVFFQEPRNDGYIPFRGKDNSTITIVLSFDKNYLSLGATCIGSILLNLKQGVKCEIVVLYSDLDSRDKFQLNQLIKFHQDVNIGFINMEDAFSDVVLPANSHFTKETFFRIKLPSLLPQYSKVLYIDADTIVNRDICELFSVNIDNYFLAGVKDIGITNFIKENLNTSIPDISGNNYFAHYADIQSLDKYINCGVMLINLDLMRKENIESKLVNYIYNKPKLVHVDQDAINSVCYGKILLLDPRWNVFNHPVFVYKYADSMDYKLIHKSRQDPYIIHYASKDTKPWVGYEVHFEDLFWYYNAYLDPYFKVTKLQPININHTLTPTISSEFVKVQLKKNIWFKILNVVSKNMGNYYIIKKSSGFDDQYYLSQYSDVWAAGMDPLKHYMNHGWKEGRNPNSWFNTSCYLNHNPDVKEKGMNPLVHYILFGQKEGRRCS